MQQNELVEEAKQELAALEALQQDSKVTEVNRIWVNALAFSRKAGITIEANCFGSPATEEINRKQIARRGDHLYFIPQHRNILHTVLLAHIEGNIEFAKVSIDTN